MFSQTSDHGSLHPELEPIASPHVLRKTRSLTSDDLLHQHARPYPRGHASSKKSRKSNSLPVPPCIRHLPTIKQPSPQDVRPLPLPPTPLSAPITILAACRTIRPLPSPPTPDSDSEPTKLAICITPATPASPLPPPPTINSVDHLVPPTSFPKPKPYSSLCLQTSPDVLPTPSIDEEAEEEDLVPSPLTPSIPQRPSPSVARRKRMSKLRRHLGESIMFPLSKERTLRPLSGSLASNDNDDDYSRESTTILFNKKDDDEDDLDLDLAEDEEMSTSDDESLVTLDDGESDKLWVVDGTTFRAATLRRYSKKWVREKGGHRWEEEDYTHILRALRSL
ncbi:hypothetical protein Moror_10711 [Moniliophthora roreri MCA 2997]|uniref:Uncharacterized protein n=1 Tax=Moniliophthora roreri (strain MCA 2997) TaxID=1381753 RepID=V2XGR5_MONRO|nr:hypothetical protein Moror_10711 [Moniliophthora roreri MCA 2997]